MTYGCRAPPHAPLAGALASYVRQPQPSGWKKMMNFQHVTLRRARNMIHHGHSLAFLGFKRRSRTGLNDGFRTLWGVLLEIFLEQTGQVPHLLLVLRCLARSLPSLLRVEDGRRHVLHLHLRMAKSEAAHGLVRGIGQIQESSVVDGVDDLSSVLQWAPVSDSVTSANPPCVQQPSRASVCDHLSAEHLSIVVGVPDQERSAEACRKGCSRLSNSHLSARHLGSVTSNEVVHGLLWRQLGNGGQHTEGVASQQNNV
mmetsp:Transcript_49977/g.109217  ORF Transcript_49977/g.109217 Transcript_49977/m.109217 type:complete len:256 (+) Transcript_49977:145-912(+)